MAEEEIVKKPYVIFSCIGPVENAKLHSSLLKFSGEVSPIVITSRKYISCWRAEGITTFRTRFNSISKYKSWARSVFLRVRVLRIGWVWVTSSKIFRKFTYFWMQPHTARHFEALRLLNELDPNDWAFLAGSRDLIFQTSPRVIATELAKQGAIHFFDEGGLYFKDGQPQLTRYSKANLGWARELMNFDDSRLSEIYDEVIINADCIFGKVSDLMVFLSKSCSLLSKSEHASYALLDQASTNFVAYEMLGLSNSKRHSNGDVVLNMCGVVDATITLRDGFLELESKRIPIVHQFDRFGFWDDKHGLSFNKREYKVQI
jgi:hypothetical protein